MKRARFARSVSAKTSRLQRRQSQFERLEPRALLSINTMHTDLFLIAASGTTVSGYTPAQIRAAYGFSSTSFGTTAADGTGQTIAIVDAYDDPNIVSDLKQFDQTFGIAAPPSLKVVNETGGTKLPGTDPSQGWEGETALDVEWAHAIAPGASILLVEANSASDTDLFAAVNYARNAPGVSTVSMSWGSDDNAAYAQYDQALSKQYLVTPTGHQGVTFVAATGDEGYTGFPATSPNVLAVGGTDLYLNSNGAIQSETAWTAQTSGGVTWSGGGGTSVEFPGRNTPDVSYNAGVGIAVYDTFGPDQGWVSFGGTSAGTPQWAALISIADQGRALKGLGSLDGASQTLPDIYSVSASDFHDITVGSTQFQTAGPGYDLATGRGSPVANKLIADLSGWASTTQTVTAPLAPANFTGQALSTTQLSVSWSLSAGATSYDLYAMNGTQLLLIGVYGSNATTATISNLGASTTFTLQVVAYNSAGSAATNWIQVSTPAALVAPLNFKVTPTSSTVAQVSWSASAGATSYTVYSWNGSQAVVVGQTTANVTSLTVSNLVAGSTDLFYVAASNATSSASTAWVIVVMPAANQLGVPIVTATATSSTSAVVSWTAWAGATGYSIYWSTGGQALKLGNVSASMTSLTVNGLAAGSTNSFYVVAFNATSSVTSATTTVVTPATTTHAVLTASLTDMVFNTIGLGHSIGV